MQPTPRGSPTPQDMDSCENSTEAMDMLSRGFSETEIPIRSRPIKFEGPDADGCPHVRNQAAYEGVDDARKGSALSFRGHRALERLTPLFPQAVSLELLLWRKLALGAVCMLVSHLKWRSGVQNFVYKQRENESLYTCSVTPLHLLRPK